MYNIVSVIGLVFIVVLGAIGPQSGAAGEGETVTVTATEFKFTPDTIKVEQGSKIRLVLNNKGALSHNITFTGLDKSSTTIQGGGQTEVVLSSLKPGRYQFMCSIPGHANAGMSGTLVVE